jgi:hypothetical protein
MDHDPKTCDCDERVNRLIELGYKRQNPVEECEFKYLSRYLMETLVLV